MGASSADAIDTSRETARRPRIDGLDVARAIAILGMVGSHTGDEGVRGDDAEGWAWLVITHGYPSALFAVLAGVSMTLMATRRAAVPIAEVENASLARTRVRIAVRAVLLMVIGLVMAALGTPVVVILTHLGVMFMLALPMLRWRTGALVAGAGIAAVGGGWLARTVAGWAGEAGIAELPVASTLWSEHYPALAWMAYIMVGLALGRMRLRAPQDAALLAVVGAGIAVAARIAERVLRSALDPVSETTSEQWLTREAHSYTPLEMIDNIGVACAVIGVALLVTGRAPRLLWPLRAAGSMALTLYVLHLIVIAIVGEDMVWEPSNVSFLALVTGLIAFACVWRAVAGQGPLERLLTASATAAARRRR